MDASAAQLAGVAARPRSGRMRPVLELMRTALLRDAAGESFVAIARRTRVSAGTPQKRYQLHRECMESAEYREAYTALLRRALQMLHGR